MFVIPPQFRDSRTPGQVPSREGMAAVRYAQQPAPPAKLTAKRLLEHGNEPRLTPEHVVKGLGMDAGTESSWVKFLGDSVGGAINELVVRKALHEKFRDTRMDPVLRSVLFARSMSFYRTRLRKSGIYETIDGAACEVLSPDELSKAMKLNEEKLAALDIGGKAKADPVAKRALVLQRKSDRELAKKRKLEEEEAKKKALSKAEGEGSRGGTITGHTASGKAIYDVKGKSDVAKVRDFISKNPHMSTDDHIAAAKNPELGHKEKMLHVLAAKLQSAAEVKHLRGELASAKAQVPVKKSLSRDEIRAFYLRKNIALAKKYAPEHAAGMEAQLEKADPKGGTYHKRVTDKKSGKHRYFYDPDKYAKHPDAHIDGAEALKRTIHKTIEERLGEGEHPVESFRDLAAKHGPDKVADALREGCGSGKYEFAAGKFRKCKGSTNVIG